MVILANRYGELEAGRLAGAAQSQAFALLDDPRDPGIAPTGAVLGMAPLHAGVVLGGAGVSIVLLAAAVAVVRAGAGRRAVPLAAVVIGGVAALAAGAGPYLAGYPLVVVERWAPDVPVVQAVVGAAGGLLAVVGLWRIGKAGLRTGTATRRG